MWENCVVTQSGIALLGKLEAIELSGAKYGVSAVSAAALTSQKSVTSPGATLNITQFKSTDEGFEVVIRADNKGVGQEYTIKQVGVYAREKGAEGDGILFAIMQDDVGNRVPAESEIPDFALQFKLRFAVSNDMEISAVIDSSILISRGEAEELIGSAVNKVNTKLNEHEKNKANPHAVTKSQVGLENVPNVATNDQTVTYTEATNNAELSSGEKLSVAFGKLAKAVKSLIAHLADKVSHITSAERTAWNGKAEGSHVHSTATASLNGFLSSTDKAKLDGIAANANNYTHPTAAGNKHIPSGGASGQILRWSSDGTAVWGADNNTTYSNMTGATADAAGKAGLVPAPAAGAATRYLRSDGTWQVPPDTNTTYANMTAATASAAGKAGLVPAPAAGKQTSFLRGDGTWVVPTDTNTAKASATASVGSASKWSAGSLPTLGTAIAADDITAWSAGSLPTLGTAIPADDITAWSAGSLPTLGTAIPADDITAWSAGTAASASVSKGVLTITNGTVPTLTYTAKSIPNVTGVGTLPSLTYAAKSIPNVTGVGTLPSLSYTARSIPNVTGVGTLPSLTVTNTTVVTGVST